MSFGKKRKIFISTTDHSGDFHGALLAAALRREDPEVELCGIGGELMAQEGVRILFNPVSHATVGFFETARALSQWKGFLNRALQGTIAEEPERIIFVDSPSFNLRLLRLIKKVRPFRFFYYISPQVWAWGRKRAEEIASSCEKIIVIFPFEVKIYERLGGNVVFVGHPFLDTVKPNLAPKEAFQYFGLSPEIPVVLFLPGSRLSEVKQIFPVMEKVGQWLVQRKAVQLVSFAASPEIAAKISGRKEIRVFEEGDRYSLFSIATMALAASGSVTLELSLLSVPFLLLYRVSSFTYFILKPVIKVSYAGITNLLLQREVVPEFIQSRCKAKYLLPAAVELLKNVSARERMKREFAKVRELLGQPGAAARAAKEILSG